MSDALTDLNQMIERIRQEADAEGYARAMREVAAFATTKAPMAARKLLERHTPPAPASGAQMAFDSAFVPEDGAAKRAPRGQNRERVESYLIRIGKPVGVKEIQDALSSSQYGDIAYSSVQNALEQLHAAGRAKVTGRGIWEYVSPDREPDRDADESGD